MNDQPKKKNAFDIADDLFANELQKAKQYDELVANLVAGHKIKPNETGDFQAVLSAVANMASAVNCAIDFGRPEGDISATLRQGPPKLSEMKDAIRKVVAGQTGNSLAIFFEEMVAKLQKVGAIEAGFPAPQQVVDVALAPYLAGWRANDLSGPMMLREDLADPYAGVLGIQRKQQEEALVAVQEAKAGNLKKLSALLNWPELNNPMKAIIDARRVLSGGRVLGGQPLVAMCEDAVKNSESFARITDTLQHYKQLRSASVVQSVKDLCNEYETIWTRLTDKNFNPGDRLKDLVGSLLDKDLNSEFFVEQLKDLFREAGLHFEKGHLLNVVERLIASDKAVGKMSAKVRKVKKKLKKAGRLESFGGADVHFGIIDEAKAIPAVMESSWRNTTAQLKTATEGLQEIGAMLYEATGGHDDFPGTVQVVAGVKTMLKRAKERVENWHEIGGLLYDVKALNSSAPLSLNNVKTAIAELNRRRQSFQQDSDDTAKYLRRCEELLQGFGSGNLEQRIREAVLFRDTVFADMKERGVVTEDGRPSNATLRGGVDNLLAKLERAVLERNTSNENARIVSQQLTALNQQVADLTDRNDSQTKFIEKIADAVREVLPGQYTFLPQIWSGVNDLVKNYQHAKEADAALEELGSEYVGTLVQKARTAVRVITGLIAQQEAAVARLASAVAKVNGVDLGDPSSDESIEAAILNLGWQRDEARKDAAQYEKTLKEQFVPKERAFANGQRVFVHYFDGYSDEYLGQKAAEVRGAKYVSGTFGWFYMVEFEEAGIGAYNFDYSEDRLALVAEAYLMKDDRVRLRDSQLEGVVISFNSNSREFTVLFDGKTGFYQDDVLTPIDQQWSIFSRKGGPRLMVLHAPDKWAAESRAAKRLSTAGKPFVTLSLIAVPGVADNANFGGVTDGVELTIFRKSGHDRNTAFSAMFDGNNVDVNNTIEAVKLILHGNEGGTTPTGERIDKMLPFLRAGSNQLKVDEQVRKDRETTAANPSRKFDDGQAVTAKYKDVSSVLFDPIIRERAAVVESAAFKKGAWLYKLEGESYVFEEDLSPRALFNVGQRVIAKQVNSDGESFAKVLFRSYSDWSKKWEYQIEITAHSLKTSRREDYLKEVPNLNHEALIQQSVQNIVDREEAETAVLSRFPVDTANLQAEADKMVGKYVDVATDAKERAIRDGAVNPDWLNWISGVVGRRFTILSAAVMNDGQVTYKIDSTVFGLGAKYFSYEF